MHKTAQAKGQKCQNKSTMKMGLNDVTVTSLEYEKDHMIIQGSNFTENSAVYIDNKKVDTIFINDKTLKIKMIKTGDTLQVKQLGRNDGLLSKSNSIDLLFSDLAKK